MRILALETIGTTGSLAALEAGQMLAESALASGTRSAQSLAPGIDALLRSLGWTPRDVQLVAVATGPGSFTGLRIGVTTAKTFAYAVNCEVLGVHTLRAIAWRAPAEAAELSAVVDAQRGELFAAQFTRDAAGRVLGEDSTHVIGVERWLAGLAGQTVTGPGLARLVERLPASVRVLEPAVWHPTATAVGQLAWQDYGEGARQSVFDLMPHYFRRTAAEEQWERRHQSK